MVRLLSLTAVLFLAACEPPDAEPDPPKIVTAEAARATGAAADAIAERAGEQQRRFSDQAREGLAELDKEIDRLRERAGELGAEARVRLEEEIAWLEARWAESRERLAELQERSGPAWDELKRSIEKALDELRDGTERAAEELRQQRD